MFALISTSRYIFSLALLVSSFLSLVFVLLSRSSQFVRFSIFCSLTKPLLVSILWTENSSWETLAIAGSFKKGREMKEADKFSRTYVECSMKSKSQWREENSSAFSRCWLIPGTHDAESMTCEIRPPSDGQRNETNYAAGTRVPWNLCQRLYSVLLRETGKINDMVDYLLM